MPVGALLKKPATATYRMAWHRKAGHLGPDARGRADGAPVPASGVGFFRCSDAVLSEGRYLYVRAPRPSSGRLAVCRRAQEESGSSYERNGPREGGDYRCPLSSCRSRSTSCVSFLLRAGLSSRRHPSILPARRHNAVLIRLDSRHPSCPLCRLFIQVKCSIRPRRASLARVRWSVRRDIPYWGYALRSRGCHML